MSDTVQQIKDKLGIVEVVSSYVKLERAGTLLRARCPFHAERTPSFTVSPDRGTYHCFGCNVGGDIFTFVETIEGLDFKGALKILADKAGVEIVYSKSNKAEHDVKDRLFEIMEVATIFFTSKLDDVSRAYLTKRGISDATMQVFRVGYVGNEWTSLTDYLKSKKFSDREIIDAGLGKSNERGGVTDKFRNRIMFPIADSAGRVVAFSGRSFGEHASSEAPKYLNSPETALFHKSHILYGYDKAKIEMRKLGCAILVEGQMDLILSHQAGWSNTVAVSGTAFTPEHATLVKRMTDNVVLALDADPAGIKAAGKAARVALSKGLNVKVAQLPTGLDPADLILSQGVDAWKAAIRDAKDIITFLLDVLQAHAKNPEAFRRAVELVVLPFLHDVASPIAREQYVNEIASRLAVSSDAIIQALAHVPLPIGDTGATPAPTHPHAPSQRKDMRQSRAEEAFSILLWQQTLPRPTIDLALFETELHDAIGADTWNHLQSLPEDIREQLRFRAERLHASDSDTVHNSTKELLHVIIADILSADLLETTRALERAERTGDEAEIERLMKHSHLLTTRIAQLHKIV
jgi:DNA primase